eukprot:Rhum_TRINITY_DN5074_c0_g1::Rhum_TRINITY_DN5074_c0_g1_i1::g.16448::m.16448
MKRPCSPVYHASSSTARTASSTATTSAGMQRASCVGTTTPRKCSRSGLKKTTSGSVDSAVCRRDAPWSASISTRSATASQMDTQVSRVSSSSLSTMRLCTSASSAGTVSLSCDPSSLPRCFSKSVSTTGSTTVSSTPPLCTATSVNPTHWWNSLSAAVPGLIVAHSNTSQQTGRCAAIAASGPRGHACTASAMPSSASPTASSSAKGRKAAAAATPASSPAARTSSSRRHGPAASRSAARCAACSASGTRAPLWRTSSHTARRRRAPRAAASASPDDSSARAPGRSSGQRAGHSPMTATHAIVSITLFMLTKRKPGTACGALTTPESQTRMARLTSGVVRASHAPLRAAACQVPRTKKTTYASSLDATRPAASCCDSIVKSSAQAVGEFCSCVRQRSACCRDASSPLLRAAIQPLRAPHFSSAFSISPLPAFPTFPPTSLYSLQ